MEVTCFCLNQSDQCVCVCEQVLEDSRAVLIAANMQPDDPFPLDDKIKEGEGLIFTHFLHFSDLRAQNTQNTQTVCVALDLVIRMNLVSLAYSHVVENTAFFGDVALRFPRIVHHYYDRNADWSRLLRWGLRFCNQTGVFSGGAHQHVLTLVRLHHGSY